MKLKLYFVMFITITGSLSSTTRGKSAWSPRSRIWPISHGKSAAISWTGAGLATGIEDTHGVPRVKPSFVPLLNRADLVVLVGFDCEHAFLPALLEASNSRIQKGNPGYVDCSQDIVPGGGAQNSTDHSEGDVHGNPHYMLDPVLGEDCDPKHLPCLWWSRPRSMKPDSPATATRIFAKLDAKIAEWEKEAQPLKGEKFVSYHGHWFYFGEVRAEIFRHDRTQGGR